MKKHRCDNCVFRGYAERKPDSLIARLWRWHTKWCPGWKAYQASLAKEKDHADIADEKTSAREQ
jgi:hypothetical protein